MRHNSIETDDIIYQILTSSQELMAAISGGVYVGGERPDNSTKEDIAVNTLTLDHEMPQTGTSNVNVHVPDIKVKIGTTQQYKMNRERLRQLTTLTTAALENAVVEGLQIRISNENILAEEGTHQHYTNIRVEWNIQKDCEQVTDSEDQSDE